MKDFDKSMDKLSNMFPDMGNLLENIKHVSNAEPDISSLRGFLKEELVEVDVFIQDAKFHYEPEDPDTGIMSPSFIVEDYTAVAKVYSIETDERVFLTDLKKDQFNLVQGVGDRREMPLDEYVVEWLSDHGHEYMSSHDSREEDDYYEDRY